MTASKRPGGGRKASRWAIERWALERIDQDAGAVRIEVVPMVSDRITSAYVNSLVKEGLKEGMDAIEIWDTDATEIRHMKLKQLFALLGVRSDEKDAVSENMVFWILHKGNAMKPEHVLHATVAARESIKAEYEEVAGRPRRGP
jgi:hypothetical protein